VRRPLPSPPLRARSQSRARSSVLRAYAGPGQAPGQGVPGDQVRSVRPRGAHGAGVHQGGQHALLRVRRKRPHLAGLSSVCPRPARIPACHALLPAARAGMSGCRHTAPLPTLHGMPQALPGRQVGQRVRDASMLARCALCLLPARAGGSPARRGRIEARYAGPELERRGARRGAPKPRAHHGLRARVQLHCLVQSRGQLVIAADGRAV
jgi:hypothetical protein